MQHSACPFGHDHAAQYQRWSSWCDQEKSIPWFSYSERGPCGLDPVSLVQSRLVIDLGTHAMGPLLAGKPRSPSDQSAESFTGIPCSHSKQPAARPLIMRKLCQPTWLQKPSSRANLFSIVLSTYCVIPPSQPYHKWASWHSQSSMQLAMCS